jgi:hypothetical protein
VTPVGRLATKMFPVMRSDLMAVAPAPFLAARHGEPEMVSGAMV